MNSFGKTYLFAFLCGVLQGCPMSASLFIFAIIPFLIHFEKILVGKYYGVVRACADDIGLCLTDFRSLGKVHSVFQAAKTLSGLTLKPKK